MQHILGLPGTSTKQLQHYKQVYGLQAGVHLAPGSAVAQAEHGRIGRVRKTMTRGSAWATARPGAR